MIHDIPTRSRGKTWTGSDVFRPMAIALRASSPPDRELDAMSWRLVHGQDAGFAPRAGGKPPVLRELDTRSSLDPLGSPCDPLRLGILGAGDEADGLAHNSLNAGTATR